MFRLFLRTNIRLLIAIFTLICLISNASMANAALLRECVRPDCLAPVVRINNSLLQQVFSELLPTNSEPDFPEYISFYQFSTNPFADSPDVQPKDIENLVAHLKNIVNLVKILEPEELIFGGILSSKEKQWLEALLQDFELKEKFSGNTVLVAVVEDILVKGLRSIQDVRNLEEYFPEILEYRFWLNRLERKFIQAKNIVAVLKSKPELSDAVIEDATEEELFGLLAQVLMEKGIDIEYVGTILLGFEDRENIKERIRYMIDVADEIAAFIHAFEQKKINANYINFMLEILIPLENAREAISIVSDVDTALSIASLLKRFEKNNVSQDKIKLILQTILRFNDVKERSSVLEAFFNSPELQFIGAIHRTTMSILTSISHLDNIKSVIEKIKAAVSNLDNDKKARQKNNDELYNSKKQGRLERSIVAVCDEADKPIGSAWVLEEREESFTLLTNNHVIDGMTEVLLKTYNRTPKNIGKARVILSYMQDSLGRRDIAVLEIKKDEVAGAPLVPIKIASGLLKEQIATLVSGYDMDDSYAVSSGQLVLAGEFGVLVGAKSRPGNSGSPVLVKTFGGYEAVAIHVAAGPISILLTESIREDLVGNKKTSTSGEGKNQFKYLSMGSDTQSVGAASGIFTANESLIPKIEKVFRNSPVKRDDARERNFKRKKKQIRHRILIEDKVTISEEARLLSRMMPINNIIGQAI